MKKTIIITPCDTQRVSDFVVLLMENPEFTEHRICARLRKPPAEELDVNRSPMELENLPWHYDSLFAETGAQLALFNHFSGNPDEVIVLYDASIYSTSKANLPDFTSGAIAIMTALPKLLTLFIQENSASWRLHFIQFKQVQTSIVSETVTGALKGFCKGLQSAGSEYTAACNSIEDESGMLPLFAAFCIKIFNTPQADSKNYVFNGKTGFFGRF